MEFYTIKELAKVMRSSDSLAQKLIFKLNGELKAQGYITLKGKIPKAYVHERFYTKEELKPKDDKN